MYKINGNIKHIECIKCFSIHEVSDYFKGCPVCLSNGEPSSVTFKYKDFNIHNNKSHLNKYTHMLPYHDFPTLGEGNTPTIELNNLRDELGLSQLYIKNEGQNPTGSHKDRMSPFIIARAKSIGMHSVAVASSGNAGVSIAAYAAAANMDCTVLTTKDINPIWKQALEKLKATIEYTITAMERWTRMEKAVENSLIYPATNFINPPVGSNPYGVQGYKTIAYEIIEFFAEIPNVIIIPCARGDLLWGIWEGFKESFAAGLIDRLPKLIAVEPFSRLERVIDGESYTNSFLGDANHTPSIGGTTVTYQSLLAITESKGEVVTIPTNQALIEQNHLGRHGIYVERSSALVLGALKEGIKKDLINKNDKVLLIISSNGYKELL